MRGQTHARAALTLVLVGVMMLPFPTSVTGGDVDSTEALRFRTEMGFPTDLAHITAVSRDAASLWDYGVALTPEEKAEIDRRIAIEAKTGPLSQFLHSVPAYAGGYTDQAGGHVFVIGFATDPLEFEPRIVDLLPAGAEYRLRQVQHPLGKLRELQDRITEDRDTLAKLGVDVNTIIVDEVNNQVEVGIAKLEDGAVATLEERYGKDVLRAFQSGGGQTTHDGCYSRSHCYGPPMRAGISVDVVGCSLAFVVNQNGRRRILTAGHNPCGSFAGNATHHGNPFGSILSRSWFGGDTDETADAATIGNLTIAQDDNLVYRTATQTDAIQVVQAEDSETYSNFVCLSARMVATIRCGTRVARFVTICFDEGCLREQREATYSIYKGDSGGAVYNGGSVAIGVQSSCIDRTGNSACEEGDTADNALYSHILNVFSELGGNMSIYTGN